MRDGVRDKCLRRESPQCVYTTPVGDQWMEGAVREDRIPYVRLLMRDKQCKERVCEDN